MRNPIINHYYSPRESELLKSIYQEAISHSGITIYYLPRKLRREDKLYGEDSISTYTIALAIPAYLQTFTGFTGDGKFFSKFGLEFRDQIQLVISRPQFTSLTTNTRTKPQEGDLVFFPYTNQLFRVLKVDSTERFFPTGTLLGWSLTAEVFEYSNELIATGIPEIDSVMDKSLDILPYSYTDTYGNILLTPSGYPLLQPEWNPERAMPSMDNIAIQEGTENFSIGTDDFLNLDETNMLNPYNP